MPHFIHLNSRLYKLRIQSQCHTFYKAITFELTDYFEEASYVSHKKPSIDLTTDHISYAIIAINFQNLLNILTCLPKVSFLHPEDTVNNANVFVHMNL